MLSCIQLEMRFGGKILFKEASLQLDLGKRYGLVGANGSGKSTLLQLLLGKQTPEKGDILRPSHAKLGALEQDHFTYENEPILSIVLQGRDELYQAILKKEKLLHEQDFSDEHCHKLEELEQIFLRHGGYSAESEAAKILEGLGIKEEVHTQNLSILSGGYKLRVLLAKLLFSEPDILLLDEPTNHLDLPSIQWLESYLKQFEGCVLVSSHDRVFLNGIATDIIDLDHQQLTHFPGNYDQFEKTKALQMEQMDAQLSNQEKRRDQIQANIDRFRSKASKARQAQSKMHLVKKLEQKMETLNLPPSSRLYPKFHFDQHRHSGAIPLKVSKLCKSYDKRNVLSQLTFEIEREDRICFVGPNGIGKSTLLNILAEKTQADEGSFSWGHAVKFAFFPQDHKQEVKPGLTALQWLDKQVPGTKEQTLRDTLARALFSQDQVDKATDILSGGETARLILAKMMLLEHNVLLFDEPTNHLDMESTEALLKALKNYPGTLLVVSHNRYFISQIANRIIEMGPAGIQDFRGSFEEYAAKKDEDILTAVLPKQEKEKKLTPKQMREEQNKVKKAFNAKEKLCHELEEELAKMNETLSADNFYEATPQDKIQELLKQKGALENELEKALADWERLGSLLLK